MTDEPPESSDLDARKVFADFIADRIEEQNKHRDRLDARTGLIVTSSGGLITAVGVIAALLPKQDQNYRYPILLIVVLTVSISLLLAAVLAAQVSAQRTGPMISTDLEHTRRFFYEPSGTGADSLRQQMTEVNLTRAKVVDILNARRMNQLYVAGFLQLLGVVGLGGSLVVFLLQNFQ